MSSITFVSTPEEMRRMLSPLPLPCPDSPFTSDDLVNMFALSNDEEEENIFDSSLNIQSFMDMDSYDSMSLDSYVTDFDPAPAPSMVPSHHLHDEPAVYEFGSSSNPNEGMAPLPAVYHNHLDHGAAQPRRRPTPRRRYTHPLTRNDAFKLSQRMKRAYEIAVRREERRIEREDAANAAIIERILRMRRQQDIRRQIVRRSRRDIQALNISRQNEIVSRRLFLENKLKLLHDIDVEIAGIDLIKRAALIRRYNIEFLTLNQ